MCAFERLDWLGLRLEECETTPTGSPRPDKKKNRTLEAKVKISAERN